MEQPPGARVAAGEPAPSKQKSRSKDQAKGMNNSAHLLFGSHNRPEKPPDPFSLIQSDTPPPTERYGHTAILDETGGGLIVIFGGCDKKGAFRSDLHFFNIEANKWMPVDVKGTPPSGRHFHSAVVFNDHIYIFGGASNAYYNDLHRFDIDGQAWSQVIYSTDSSPPSPRYGHTAVVFGACMYIFGGFDKDGFACNELFEFSFETNRWRQLKPQPGGVVPRDAYYHTAVVHQGSMYVFGGYKHDVSQLWEYRFGNNAWSVLNTNGDGPAPRWGHKSVLHKGIMYCFGGRDTVTNYHDVHEFHFETQTWRRAPDEGISARFFCSLVVDDEYMYVFGGRNLYNFVFNELYKYNLASKRKRRPDTLVEDFRRLINQRELSDVVFLFPEEPGAPPIYAHKTILAARCEIFKAMFATPMKEARESTVNVRDVRYPIFYSLLQYIYTGQLFASSDIVVDVLRVADMYRLEHLKALCERKVMRYIDSKNVISMLQLAEQYKAPELRQYCTSLAAKLLPDLRETDSFKALPLEVQAVIVAQGKKEREAPPLVPAAMLGPSPPGGKP